MAQVSRCDLPFGLAARCHLRAVAWGSGADADERRLRRQALL